MGGRADFEARIGRLPEYILFQQREPLTEAERKERMPKGVLCPPKLPPVITMVVDVDPDVVAISMARREVNEDCRRSARTEHLTAQPKETKGPARIVPPCVGADGMDLPGRIKVQVAILDEVTATHSACRRYVIGQVLEKTSFTNEASEKEGKKEHLLLRFCPDLLPLSQNILTKYEEDRMAVCMFLTLTPLIENIPKCGHVFQG